MFVTQPLAGQLILVTCWIGTWGLFIHVVCQCWSLFGDVALSDIRLEPMLVTSWFGSIDFGFTNKIIAEGSLGLESLWFTDRID